MCTGPGDGFEDEAAFLPGRGTTPRGRVEIEDTGRYACRFQCRGMGGRSFRFRSVFNDDPFYGPGGG